MPCWWFDAIPLSCISSPYVQSCDSLMKRLWWKLWDNIIFGGVPFRALRSVHDPARETWPGLWFTAVQLGAYANSSLSAVELGVFENLYQTISAVCRWVKLPFGCQCPLLSSLMLLQQWGVQKGHRSYKTFCEHKAENDCEHHHMWHYKEGCRTKKTVNRHTKKLL